MNTRSLLPLCVLAASCLLATHSSRADQTTAKPYPDWPWPKGVHEPPKPDDGQVFHIPGSAKSYTDTQINRSTSTVDWFPDLHPAPPAPVISGRPGTYNA